MRLERRLEAGEPSPKRHRGGGMENEDPQLDARCAAAALVLAAKRAVSAAPSGVAGVAAVGRRGGDGREGEAGRGDADDHLRDDYGFVEGDQAAQCAWPSWGEALELAGLRLARVPRDGACGYWAVGVQTGAWGEMGAARVLSLGGQAGRTPLEPSVSADRALAVALRGLRRRVAAFLMRRTTLPMLVGESGYHVDFEAFVGWLFERELVSAEQEALVAAACIDSNTRGRERVRQLLGCGSGVVEGLRADLEAEFQRLESPSAFEPGYRFNGLAVAVHEDEREWAGEPQLRAMAVLFDVDIAVLTRDGRGRVGDRANLYEGGAAIERACIYRSLSWRTELAPRVQHERGPGGVLQGHRRLVVLCFSGTRLSGHFDSVAPITRVGRGA